MSFRSIERKLDLILLVLSQTLVEEIAEEILEHEEAISAKGEVMPASIKVGGAGAKFAFTEFDGLNGTGNKVAASGPISYASDNTAVATVDDAGNVSAVSAGTANITGVDAASLNKVAAGDVVTVTSDVPPPAVALSATGVLTAN